MGIYMNMLREGNEFNGNTDFDDGSIVNGSDGYAQDLRDIASVVDDLNTTNAEESAEDALDGQDLESNPVEEAYMCMYESEVNFNNIMKAIAVKELNEAGRGREMVMESVDIKGFFTKVKDMFVLMYKKITAIVKNWLDNAAAKFKTNKQFIAKYKGKLEDGKKAFFAADKKDFKGFKFESKLFDGAFKSLGAAADKEISAVKSVTSTINAAINKDHSDELNMTRTISSLNLNCSSIMNPDMLRGNYISAGHDEVSESEFSKALKEAYFGGTEKEVLSSTDAAMNSAEITKILEGSSKLMSDAKAPYKKTKDAFNTIISSLDSIEKKLKTLDSSATVQAMLTTVTKFASNAKSARNSGHVAYTVYLSAMRARVSQSRKVANLYIYALNKGTRNDKIVKAGGKVKGVNASYIDAGFLSNVELI